MQLHSLSYLKKLSSWKISQGSLSRVLSFRQGRHFGLQSYKTFGRPVQSPTSSEHGSIISSLSCRASSPPDFGRPTSPVNEREPEDALPKNPALKKRFRHRRAKSIGDIAVSPV